MDLPKVIAKASLLRVSCQWGNMKLWMRSVFMTHLWMDTEMSCLVWVTHKVPGNPTEIRKRKKELYWMLFSMQNRIIMRLGHKHGYNVIHEYRERIPRCAYPRI